MNYKPLHTASSVPAATGKVGIDRTKAGNMNLDLEVHYLAPPGNVKSDANVYVVWSQPLDGSGSPNNIGVLRVGENRSGSFKTKTTAQDIKLTITPEPSARIEKPSNAPVMTAMIHPYR